MLRNLIKGTAQFLRRGIQLSFAHNYVVLKAPLHIISGTKMPALVERRRHRESLELRRGSANMLLAFVFTGPEELPSGLAE